MSYCFLVLPACGDGVLGLSDLDVQQAMACFELGCFNITANLDHLDYDCVVVAGSVHACTWIVCEVVISA